MVATRFICHRADGRTEMHEVQARPGQCAMRADLDAGIDGIAAECGGLLVCAACPVCVPPDRAARLGPPGEDEQAMLDFTAAPRRDTSRLCNQIRPGPDTEGLTLVLPDRQD